LHFKTNFPWPLSDLKLNEYPVGRVSMSNLFFTMILLLYILLVANMIYGIVHVVRNKQLLRFEKILWVFIVICMPVIGTSLYLRSTFVTHHGQW
jgi:hypothetical protein